MTLKNG